jgi:hypothetical protein
VKCLQGIFLAKTGNVLRVHCTVQILWKQWLCVGSKEGLSTQCLNRGSVQCLKIGCIHSTVLSDDMYIHVVNRGCVNY